MNTELFINGLNKLNIPCTPEQTKQFQRYSALLKEWNANINLTAITDDDGIAVKHFLDSVLPAHYLDFANGAKVADVGTGAGFPGLPLKIIRPDLRLTLIDSLNKRIKFLSCVTEELGLQSTECIHGRAEELSRDKAYRERFDIVVSRAVADMTVLCEYCLPYVKTGGIFAALKARDAEEEISAAKPIIGTLGGEIEDIISAPVPQSDIIRTIAVIRKTKPTPPAFPRSSKRIKDSAGKIKNKTN